MQEKKVRDAASKIGGAMASKLFVARSGKNRRNVEVHLNEVTLAAMLAVAWELGFLEGVRVEGGHP